MNRRTFISLAGTAAVATPLSARAQRAGKQPQVAVWMGRANDPEGQRHASAFRAGLQALGWTNGTNIRIDFRWVTGDADRFSLAKDVLEQGPDAIVAETTPAVAALARQRSATPIVFVNVSDPEGAGFVEGLARPGGTITGFISNEPMLGSKWVELLKEIAPTTERMGFMFNPDAAAYAQLFFHRAEAAARSQGVRLTATPIHDDVEIEHRIAELGSAPGGGLIVLPDPITNTHSALIIRLAAQRRLPAAYAWGFQTSGGGLISYGCDLAESFRAAASYVDRILRGQKPAELPVQLPTRFSLVVNLKTAKALGLTVPPAIMLRATEVIE
jgi:putative tryptophan/tyrosine transport system substrate-binding protein